jgi:PhnB protein
LVSFCDRGEALGEVFAVAR